MTLGGKRLGAGSSPALHRDVTGARQERTLGRAQEGAKDLVLLSCSPAAVCPRHLLTAAALAAHGRFLEPVPVSWRGRARSPLLRQRGARPVLLENGRQLGRGSPHRAAGTGPKATRLCTFVRWDSNTIKFSE